MQELKLMKMATREVILEFATRFVAWILLKHRCAKILDKMK